MNRKRSLVELAIALLVILAASTAGAKSATEKVRELERKIEALQKTYLTNNREVASAVSRAEAVQREAAALKGTIESNRHLIEAQSREMQRLFGDLDHRLAAIEERMQVISSQMSKAIGKMSPDLAKEGDLYQAGLDKIQDGDYLGAASSFRSFLDRYPKSQFAPMAQFWIGEAFFAMRDYQRAIKEYQNVISKHPRHEKAKTALLNQGLSFYELGMLDEARAFLDKVVKNYNGSVEATRAKAKIERIEERKAKKAEAAPAGTIGTYPEETIQQSREKDRKSAPEAAEPAKPETAPEQDPLEF